MKDSLAGGATGEIRHRVVTADLVSSIYPTMPPVLSTPRLLELMERAAYESIHTHLDPGEVSLGVGFDFQHLAPTPCGEMVVATAQVTAVQGHQIRLEISARDSRQTIARGTHLRVVVDLEQFKSRLRQETG